MMLDSKNRISSIHESLRSLFIGQTDSHTWVRPALACLLLSVLEFAFLIFNTWRLEMDFVY
jgi:hypothetical protein